MSFKVELVLTLNRAEESLAINCMLAAPTYRICKSVCRNTRRLNLPDWSPAELLTHANTVKERQKQRNHMLPEQYRYLVWQLALLSSGRRWLPQSPFWLIISCSQKEQISIPRPLHAQPVNILLKSFIFVLFWMFFLLFFPHVLYFLEKQSFGSEPQLYNNILFLTLFSEHLLRPLKRIRIFLKANIFTV